MRPHSTLRNIEQGLLVGLTVLFSSLEARKKPPSDFPDSYATELRPADEDQC